MKRGIKLGWQTWKLTPINDSLTRYDTIYVTGRTILNGLRRWRGGLYCNWTWHAEWNIRLYFSPCCGKIRCRMEFLLHGVLMKEITYQLPDDILEKDWDIWGYDI